MKVKLRKQLQNISQKGIVKIDENVGCKCCGIYVRKCGKIVGNYKKS